MFVQKQAGFYWVLLISHPGAQTEGTALYVNINLLKKQPRNVFMVFYLRNQRTQVTPQPEALL